MHDRRRARFSPRGFVLLALAACGSSESATDPIELVPEHQPVARGIALPGDSHGAWWDAPTSSLYLTDDTNGALVRWTEAGGFTTVARLPSSAGLGGVVRIADGLLVTSFGFGTEGAIYRVTDRGDVTPVPGLDPARRRTGLSIGPDGTIYVAYFIVSPGGGHRGGVARLALDGGETTVVEADLEKPIGVAATNTAVYVTDQHRSALVAYAIHDTTHSAVIATTLRDPDLVEVLPDGDLVTGSRDGAIYRVTPGGAVTMIASGFEQIRGTAFDPVGHRLFAIEHSAATSQHHLHIVPLR